MESNFLIRLESQAPHSFEFLDPNQVLHAVHLIPAFHWGRVTTKYLPQSQIACGIKDLDHDWQLYYIRMYV